jgi:prevent-host-death family protein
MRVEITVDATEAEIRFAECLSHVEQGGEVVITRSGRSVARMVPLRPRGTPRLGTAAGKISIRGDFDDPLPPELLTRFYGGEEPR